MFVSGTPKRNTKPNPAIKLRTTEPTAPRANKVRDWTLCFLKKTKHVKKDIITNTKGIRGRSSKIARANLWFHPEKSREVRRKW